jgi:hypothetical protein
MPNFEEKKQKNIIAKQKLRRKFLRRIKDCISQHITTTLSQKQRTFIINFDKRGEWMNNNGFWVWIEIWFRHKKKSDCKNRALLWNWEDRMSVSLANGQLIYFFFQMIYDDSCVETNEFLLNFKLNHHKLN